MTQSQGKESVCSFARQFTAPTGSDILNCSHEPVVDRHFVPGIGDMCEIHWLLYQELRRIAEEEHGEHQEPSAPD